MRALAMRWTRKRGRRRQRKVFRVACTPPRCVPCLVLLILRLCLLLRAHLRASCLPAEASRDGKYADAEAQEEVSGSAGSAIETKADADGVMRPALDPSLWPHRPLLVRLLRPFSACLRACDGRFSHVLAHAVRAYLCPLLPCCSPCSCASARERATSSARTVVVRTAWPSTPSKGREGSRSKRSCSRYCCCGWPLLVCPVGPATFVLLHDLSAIPCAWCVSIVHPVTHDCEAFPCGLPSLSHPLTFCDSLVILCAGPRADSRRRLPERADKVLRGPETAHAGRDSG